MPHTVLTATLKPRRGGRIYLSLCKKPPEARCRLFRLTQWSSHWHRSGITLQWTGWGPPAALLPQAVQSLPGCAAGASGSITVPPASAVSAGILPHSRVPFSNRLSKLAAEQWDGWSHFFFCRWCYCFLLAQWLARIVGFNDHLLALSVIG